MDISERRLGDWFVNPRTRVLCVRQLNASYAEASAQDRGAEFVRGLMADALNDWMLPLKRLERIACYAKGAGIWQEFRDWAAAAPPAHMAAAGRINETGDPDISEVLWEAKYRGIPQAREPQTLFETARLLAERVHPWPAALDALFALGKQGMSWTEWENKVRTAFAVNMIVRDMDWHFKSRFALIDQGSRRRALHMIDRGALIMVSHAGFYHIARAFLHKRFPNAFYLAAIGAWQNSTSMAADPRAALFAGLRALSGKREVVISPDGKGGTQSEPLPMLGTTVTLGMGAPFLAYESQCPVVWLSTGIDRDRFVISVTRGPQADTNEDFGGFTCRLLNFYLEMLRQQFTGDPLNLAMDDRWLNHFWHFQRLSPDSASSQQILSETPGHAPSFLETRGR
jgi:hypothetical protein